MKNINDLLNNNSAETYNKEAEIVLKRVAGLTVTKGTKVYAANDNHQPQQSKKYNFGN